MKVGYARVSSKDQNLSRQIESLQKSGCKKIFQEKISGKNTNRPELQKMLKFIRDDDEIVVEELDRLGRNMFDIKQLLQLIQQKGATVDILNLPSFKGVEDSNLRALLTSLIIDLYSYIAQNEREKILDRQKQGIKIAKQQGKFKGRSKKFTSDNRDVQNAITMYEHRTENKLSVGQIARANNMSRATLYNLLRMKSD